MSSPKVRRVEITDEIPSALFRKIISRMVSDVSYTWVVCSNPGLLNDVKSQLERQYYSMLFRDEDDLVMYKDFVEDIQDQVFLVISNLVFKELPTSKTSAKEQRRLLGELKSDAMDIVTQYMMSQHMADFHGEEDEFPFPTEEDFQEGKVEISTKDKKIIH